MMTITVLDWVIVAIFLVSFISAAMNGFFVELCSIFGLIAGVLIAGMYCMRLEPWVLRIVHSVPAAEAASFLLIAIGVLIAAGIVGRMLRLLLRTVGLGWADRLLGLVFGAVKGCFITTLLVMAVTAFFPGAPWVKHSQLVPYFLGAARQGSAIVPDVFGEQIRRGVRIFGRESPHDGERSGIVAF